MKPLALGVLGSGKGSNCRAILEAIRSGRLNAEVRVVIADVVDAGILDIAQEFAIAKVYLPPGRFRTILEPEIERELVSKLKETGVELVVLAGFMRVLKAPMLEAFPRRIINIHPSLLPKFPGREAWAQALASGETVTGCTVHFVAEGVDTGDVIAQRDVAVLPGDTPATLHARIQAAEHQLYPAVIGSLAKRFSNTVG
jgi:phosphoribosylglycinamide formyltransferase 1